MRPEMKHDEAISEVLRLLGDNKKRQFPFLTEKEESAIYVLTGNCYRTQAEAEANIDKHIQAWRDAGGV